MFALKKIISAFLLPPGLLVVLFFFFSAFFFFRGRRRTSALFLLLSLSSWFFSSGFMAGALTCAWERAYLPPSRPEGDVIVALGGGKMEGLGGVPEQDSLDGIYRTRLLAAYRLHRASGLPVIVTGGGARGEPKEALAARELLLELGMDGKKIYAEEKSKDTRENAVFSREICAEKGFSRPIVVTDAGHMRRSLFAFRSAGFASPSPYVSSFACSRRGAYWMDLLPGDFGPARAVLYEALGLIFYKLKY